MSVWKELGEEYMKLARRPDVQRFSRGMEECFLIMLLMLVVSFVAFVLDEGIIVGLGLGIPAALAMWAYLRWVGTRGFMLVTALVAALILGLFVHAAIAVIAGPGNLRAALMCVLAALPAVLLWLGIRRMRSGPLDRDLDVIWNDLPEPAEPQPDQPFIHFPDFEELRERVRPAPDGQWARNDWQEQYRQREEEQPYNNEWREDDARERRDFRQERYDPADIPVVDEWESADEADPYPQEDDGYFDARAPEEVRAACVVLRLPTDLSFTRAQLLSQRRVMLKRLHPDRGGDARLAQGVNQAVEVIRQFKGWRR